MSTKTLAKASGAKQKKLKPRVVTAEQGEAINPFGLDVRVLLNSEDTGGSFSA